MKRVMVVGAFPPAGSKAFGGVVTSCRALLNSSFPNRFRLVLVDSTQASNPPPHFLLRLGYSIPRFISFMRGLLLKKPDAVLLFASSGASLVEKGTMAWACKLFGVPVLISPRSGRIIDDFDASFLSRAVSLVAFRPAACIVCQGPRWQTFATSSLGFRLADAPIVPNWTATQELLTAGRRRLGGHRRPAVRLLFLASIERRKGIFELLLAASQLPAHQSFVISIVGQGSAEQEARRLAVELGLADRVTFGGRVDRSDIETLLSTHDILVLPSWAEGLPNAMIEAMAAGLAVIVSAVGNIPDLVVDGEEALLVEPQNVGSLLAAMETLLSDAHLFNKIARNGHMLASREFSVEIAAGRLDAIISQVVEDKG